MVWWLILPILAPLLTYGVGSLIGLLFVTFFLKQIISVVAMIFAGIVLLNLVKNMPKLKKKQATLYVLLILGFLLVPVLLNSGFGKIIGIANFAPIVPISSIIGTGSVASASSPLAATNDMGLIIALVVAGYFALTKSGQEKIKKLTKMI